MSDGSENARQAALDYHEFPRPGKLEIRATKPMANQRDLSRAYSPGVAEACLEIKADPADAARYTATGNLVAVVSNGSAVLGLGNIGALASQAGDGGQGGALQEVRQHRLLRHRGERERPGEARRDRRRAWSRPSARSTSRTSRRRSASSSSGSAARG